MKQILLDTNFVVQATKWKIDLFRELRRVIGFAYEPVVLNSVIKELEKLKEGKGRKKEDAAVALLVLKKVKIIRAIGGGSVDGQLVRSAVKHKGVVATQDGELKRILKKKGIPVIIIRQKSHFVLMTP